MAEYDTLASNITNKTGSARPLNASVTFLVTFVLSCCLVNALVTLPIWRPDIPGITTKLERFDEMVDQLDTIVIGSSHIYYGFIPEIYNESDTNRRSFNFGVEGMSIAERSSIIDHICDAKPRRLKRVFIEPENRMLHSFDDILARRSRYYFSFLNILELTRTKLISNRPISKRIGSSVVPVVGAALNGLNLGVLSDCFLPNPAKRTNEGLSSEELNTSIWDGSHRFTGAKQVIEKSLRSLRSTQLPMHRSLRPDEYSLIKKDIQKLEQLGVSVGLIFPPTTVGFEEDFSIREFSKENGHKWIVSMMPDSDAWAHFDTSDVWYDRTHLNEEGATVFSRLLAEQTIQYEKQNPSRLSP